jgi:DNA-binding GntR family transcriptional regulator
MSTKPRDSSSGAPPLAVPRRQILSDGVYEALKELVMDHGLEPGARVSIDDLARRLSVSQTPVREALARLESDGLVVKEPLRGYRTAPLLDADAFEQLYELRLLLEPRGARRAAKLATDGQLAILANANDGMRRAIGAARKARTYREYRTFAAQDAMFHDTIAAASGNEFLRDSLARWRSHLHLYRLSFHGGIAVETLPEHEQVLAALRSRKPAAAEAAMAEHVKNSQERLQASIAATSGH